MNKYPHLSDRELKSRLPDRYYKIYKMKVKGTTNKQIAEKENVSKSRVGQILRKIEYYLGEFKPKLTARSYNILRKQGFDPENKEGIKKAIENEEFKLSNVNGMGDNSFIEICQWVGIRKYSKQIKTSIEFLESQGFKVTEI